MPLAVLGRCRINGAADLHAAPPQPASPCQVFERFHGCRASRRYCIGLPCAAQPISPFPTPRHPAPRAGGSAASCGVVVTMKPSSTGQLRPNATNSVRRAPNPSSVSARISASASTSAGAAAAEVVQVDKGLRPCAPAQCGAAACSPTPVTLRRPTRSPKRSSPIRSGRTPGAVTDVRRQHDHAMPLGVVDDHLHRVEAHGPCVPNRPQ